jgi:hypothetical protein
MIDNKEFSMRLTALIIPTLLSLPISAIELSDLKKLDTSSVEQLKKSASDLSPLKTNDMISYAAKQLNLSEGTVSAGFGSLLKAAKNNLSSDNFAMISNVIPNVDNYLDKAPKESTSSLTSLLSSAGDSGKKAESLNYLNSAFKQLGISSEQVPAMLDAFNGYLTNNGYGEAAKYLQQGLSFL